MIQPAISIENIGKKYKLGLAAKKNQTFGEALINVVKGPFKRLGTLGEKSKTGDDIFWALKNISFEVAPGKVVGIIGRNGAGKSTLLKVLSRITEPTEGQAIIRGRVGSLLEVGTGFHPELTGRENIYLNGAILGMSRIEIRQKFDEIVDFSGVEKFLDTPVKHYSSGMYVRLAFAVAAHLEPEILIVDEVLAVGDAEFQKKCLGKMKDVASGGRTVLFVSHNMAAISQLCTSCIHLDAGKVLSVDNNVDSAVQRYLRAGFDSECPTIWDSPEKISSNKCFAPQRFELVDDIGERLSPPVRAHENVWIECQFYIQELDPALTVGYAIYTESGQMLYMSFHTDGRQEDWPKLRAGINKLKARIPGKMLNAGQYRVELLAALFNRGWIFKPSDFEIAVGYEISGGLSESPYWTNVRSGVLAPDACWNLVE